MVTTCSKSMVETPMCYPCVGDQHYYTPHLVLPNHNATTLRLSDPRSISGYGVVMRIFQYTIFVVAIFSDKCGA